MEAFGYKSTLDAVYDMFALGGAYRSRTDEDCILLFKNAFEENQELALKCLFYLRDIRGGQGERRFFRVCFKWLAKEYPEVALRNLINIPEFGRWDDLYSVVYSHNDVAIEAFKFMKNQLELDKKSLDAGEKEGVSLLAKWLKSENASSIETKKLATATRKALHLSHKEYRKILSALRSRINIVEKLMSEGKWEEIQYAKLPSKAGLIYRNAFARRDAERYEEFINNKETKVNAGTLYPYDIVQKVTNKLDWRGNINIEDTEREVLNKYWGNQDTSMFNEASSILCVCDTSGSMTSKYGTSVAPIDIAISLSIICAENNKSDFKNKYISFSSRPQFIEIEGVDFVDKVQRIYRQNLCENTDLKATFDLIKNAILKTKKIEDLPKTIVVLSDMEIDSMSYWRDKSRVKTEIELMREEWARNGLKLPRLVYWNCAARNNNILDEIDNDDITYVSGASPIIFNSILRGLSGKQLMLEKLNSKRYENVK